MQLSIILSDLTDLRALGTQEEPTDVRASGIGAPTSRGTCARDDEFGRIRGKLTVGART